MAGNIACLLKCAKMAEEKKERVESLLTLLETGDFTSTDGSLPYPQGNSS
jgi:hypothetical protein